MLFELFLMLLYCSHHAIAKDFNQGAFDSSMGAVGALGGILGALAGFLALGRRQLEQEAFPTEWCGMSEKQCANLVDFTTQPFEDIKDCESLETLIFDFGCTACCQLGGDAHEAIGSFMTFQQKYHMLFAKAKQWDLQCGTSLTKIAKWVDLAEDLPHKPAKLECRKPKPDFEDQFGVIVFLHGETGSHMSAVVEVNGNIIDYISWTGPHNVTPQTIFNLADFAGHHVPPLAFAKASNTLELKFPMSVLPEFLRTRPVDGASWNMFQESCAAIIHKMVSKAFGMTEDCDLPDLGLFYHPADVFELLSDAGERSLRGEIINGAEYKRH